MAIRYREGRLSPWQVYWNNPFTGKRESQNFVTEHEAKRHDSLIKHRMHFDRESFKKDTEGDEKLEVATLEAIYLMYLKQKQFSKKSLTCQLDSMRPILRAIGSDGVESIDKAKITSIMRDMLRTDLKPVTVRGRLSVLRTVLRWSVEHGFRSAPVDFPKLPAAQYDKFIPPTPEELGAIMSAASPHIARVVILGAQLGVRVGASELLKLTWDDVDFMRQVLRVHGAKKNTDALWREVPIRESLICIFKSWYDEDTRIGARQIIHYRGEPIHSIKTAWKATLQRAGITRRIRPYDLRHAFATELIAAGADVGTVAKLMGHATPTMLLTHYQYVLDKQKVAAVESLPDIKHVPNSMCPKKRPLTDLQ